ncbi:MAG: hypothetical protein QM765_41350 [Myxococcales bacterium]
MSDDDDKPEKKPNDLPEQLSRLPEKAPAPEAPSAMCYVKAVAPHTVDHLCRVCGMRTEYPLPASLPRIDVLERLLPKLEGWRLSLDDRELCGACTPARPADPGIVLVAKRVGASDETRTRGITEADLKLLRTFAQRSWLARLLPAPGRVKQLLGLA